MLRLKIEARQVSDTVVFIKISFVKFIQIIIFIIIVIKSLGINPSIAEGKKIRSGASCWLYTSNYYYFFNRKNGAIYIYIYIYDVSFFFFSRHRFTFPIYMGAKF